MICYHQSFVTSFIDRTTGITLSIVLNGITGFWLFVMVYEVRKLWKLKTLVESLLDIVVLMTTFGSIVCLIIHFYISHSLNTILSYFYFLQLSLEIGDFAVIFAWVNLVFHLQIFPIFERLKNFSVAVSGILLKLITGFSMPLLVGFGLFFFFEIPTRIQPLV